MTDRDDRATRLRSFFAGLEAMRPDGPAAVEQLRAALDHIPVSALRTEESTMTTPTPPALSPAVDQFLAQAEARQLQHAPSHLPAPRVPGVYAHGGVLVVGWDPACRPRRADGPRLRVRSVEGHKITLPAADARNLTGAREPLLFVAEWEIWLIDEDGREQMVEHHGTGAGALNALPRLMRQLGLLNEDGTRPSAKGGVSDAA